MTGYSHERMIDDLLKRYAQFRAVRGWLCRYPCNGLSDVAFDENRTITQE